MNNKKSSEKKNNKKSSKNIEEILSDVYAISDLKEEGMMITLNNKYGQHSVIINKKFTSRFYLPHKLIAGMEHIHGVKDYTKKILNLNINIYLQDIPLQFYKIAYLKNQKNEVIYQAEKK